MPVWCCPEEYDLLSERAQKQNARLLARLADEAPEPVSVLELGCGTGLLTEELVQRRDWSRLTALDLSQPMLEKARSKPELRSVELVQSDFWGFSPRRQFDRIYSNAFFHWLYPGYEPAVTKVASLLASGGLLLLATAGRNRESDHFDELIASALAMLPSQAPTGVPFVRRRLTASQLRQLGEKHGLAARQVFLLERKIPFTVEAYCDWLLASGGPWEEMADWAALRPRLVEAFTQRFGGSTFEAGHWSLFGIFEAR